MQNQSGVIPRTQSKMKTALCLGLSLSLTQIPQLAFSQTEMITNQVIVTGQSSEAKKENLQALMDQKEVMAQLEKWGVTPAEAKERVAALSPAELERFSQQVEQARAGGDILITVLVVVLIIFLIQRI